MVPYELVAFSAKVSSAGVVCEMTRILQILRIVQHATLAFVLLAVGIGVTSARRGATALTAKAALTLDGIDATVANLNATLMTINRPCGGGKPCGTLADVAKTLGTLRGTAGQIEIAANHEDRRIGILDAQEDALFADTHRTLGSANAALVRFSTAMDTADATIAGLRPIEGHAATTLASIQELLPDLAKTTANVTAMTESGKSILADGAYETHKLTHPKKKTGFWVGFWFVVEQLKPPIF